jgi:hypothetical protein
VPSKTLNALSTIADVSSPSVISTSKLENKLCVFVAFSSTSRCWTISYK